MRVLGIGERLLALGIVDLEAAHEVLQLVRGPSQLLRLGAQLLDLGRQPGVPISVTQVMIETTCSAEARSNISMGMRSGSWPLSGT